MFRSAIRPVELVVFGLRLRFGTERSEDQRAR